MLKRIPEERLVVICSCHDPEHQIQFTYDPEEFDDGYDAVYVQTHLNRESFFKRILYAVK